MFLVAQIIRAHGFEKLRRFALAKVYWSHLTPEQAIQIGVAIIIALQIVSARHAGSEVRAAEMNALAVRNAGTLTLSIGDRVKAIFFERIQTADDTTTSSNVVERVELTGEYTVQQDGNLFLPLLGPTHGAGKTIQQVLTMMEMAFKSTFDREAIISLVIIEREPIYVVGPVSRPGTFKYTPGMTILHAVALSGGFDGSSADVMQYLEAIRETERVQRGAERLKRLLARSTVLRAERLGQPIETPASLVELAGMSGAEALLADVVNLRKLLADARKAQSVGLDTAISSAKRELESLQTRAAHIQSNIKARSERLNELRLLRDRGSGSGFAMLQARTDLEDVQERMQEALSAITRTELRLAQSEQERVKLVADAEIERERDLVATENEIAQEWVMLATSRHLVSAITKKAYNLPGAKQNLTFQVVRRTAAGPDQFSADEATLLQPGDLIRISSKIEATRAHPAQVDRQ